MPQEQIIAVVVLAVMGFIMLLFVASFARLFSVWLRAFLSGAPVSLPTLLLMRFRRSPIEEIVRLKIMAAQAGLQIPTSKIESAALQGADIERAVLAIIRAKEIGAEVTWEEVVSQDMNDRLRNELFPNE